MLVWAKDMGKFKVTADKEKQLLSLMSQLGVNEADLVENFIRGGGHGGQKKNKTSSCVHLRHLPSGTEVRCQASRSQSLNRFLARRELCEKIQEQILGKQSRRQQAAEKTRRQKRRRSRRAKEKILSEKHERAEVKALRRAYLPDD